MPTVLSVGGRHATAEITVNGTPAGKLLFDGGIDLAPYLKDGRNVIGITVCNSMRNAMGPHHRSDPEPYYLGPQTFSYEGEWTGRECKDFLARYSFVRFGITE